jgi:hypothetical protein
VRTDVAEPEVIKVMIVIMDQGEENETVGAFLFRDDIDRAARREILKDQFSDTTDHHIKIWEMDCWLAPEAVEPRR